MLLFIGLLLLSPALAQNCGNAGYQNGSTCACPVGFGGSDCLQPACGGTIFEGQNRRLVPTSSTAPNITSAGCECSNGWIGVSCNVCQSNEACKDARKPTSSAALPGLPTQDLVCNKEPKVWASSQMSCNVINPTLQGIYPGTTTLNIIRTIDPSLSPLPNTTSFGTAGTAFAALFYDGVEQFHCNADSCTQDLSSGGANWKCQNLRCNCLGGTTFCGGTPNGNLTSVINSLGGGLDIECDPKDASAESSPCHFKQGTLNSLFGSSGLGLTGCMFGECVAQNVVDGSAQSTSAASAGSSLSGGVIAGLAVVGALLLIALSLFLFGFINQRMARRVGYSDLGGHRAGIEWSNITYTVPGTSSGTLGLLKTRRDHTSFTSDKVILDNVTGRMSAGQIMAVLGPSGAGKTTLIEILAGKQKSGRTGGAVTYPSSSLKDQSNLRIGFVPQQDVLPPMLTVYEALLFAARLRLPEAVTDLDKAAKVEVLMERLGITHLKDVRIGWADGRGRGISGGEMRRVSIGLELIAAPDLLILDEPTSGLDSVSAARVAKLLHSIAHDPENPIAVIASIHQPSSQLYHAFDSVLVLSHGRALYSGPGGMAPVEAFSRVGGVPDYPSGYNVADYLLEVASDPPLVLFQSKNQSSALDGTDSQNSDSEGLNEKGGAAQSTWKASSALSLPRSRYATTFLTQLQYLSGREWKILRRDKSLFVTHAAVAAVLGVFCGGLYYQTGITIAGFQSRVGCLFFLGALIAFSALSALYNIVEVRPLFLRERSSSYYSPTAWLLSRVFFDVIPLRIIPTIIVSTITYWMAGLAPNAAIYFKFLLVLVLFTLAMTLFNFLLGSIFRNGGIAILLSALTALYQMTFAGFFVNLNSIPPVLRWLQWLCPLKFCLEALSVNEVGSGLMIEDTLEGVPVNVSAALIMKLLFGFGLNNYYRDVLVLFAFIAGFGIGVIGVVWFNVRERR